MASAEIGALRVRLDMDTATFVADAKRAQDTVGKLGNSFGVSSDVRNRGVT